MRTPSGEVEERTDGIADEAVREAPVRRTGEATFSDRRDPVHRDGFSGQERLDPAPRGPTATEPPSRGPLPATGYRPRGCVRQGASRAAPSPERVAVSLA